MFKLFHRFKKTMIQFVIVSALSIIFIAPASAQLTSSSVLPVKVLQDILKAITTVTHQITNIGTITSNLLANSGTFIKTLSENPLGQSDTHQRYISADDIKKHVKDTSDTANSDANSAYASNQSAAAQQIKTLNSPDTLNGHSLISSHTLTGNTIYQDQSASDASKHVINYISGAMEGGSPKPNPDWQVTPDAAKYTAYQRTNAARQSTGINGLSASYAHRSAVENIAGFSQQTSGFDSLREMSFKDVASKDFWFNSPLSPIGMIKMIANLIPAIPHLITTFIDFLEQGINILSAIVSHLGSFSQFSIGNVYQQQAASKQPDAKILKKLSYL